MQEEEEEQDSEIYNKHLDITPPNCKISNSKDENDKNDLEEHFRNDNNNNRTKTYHNQQHQHQ